MSGEDESPGISLTVSGGGVTYTFNRGILGALPTQVGLVLAGTSGPVTVVVYDAFGRQMGTFSGEAVASGTFLELREATGFPA